jgi:hypothetical protein
VGRRAVLDTEARGEILCPCPYWKSNSGRPVLSQTLQWLSYPAYFKQGNHSNDGNQNDNGNKVAWGFRSHFDAQHCMQVVM